ncbi:FkbM family methyltransferase [Streptomyces sp. P1-3]|uniref:FkbM family methyltransferase n=1 Tax=Streptomyces sp. P1-3 TaxID=3421658 RepID=UPI003D35CFAA
MNSNLPSGGRAWATRDGSRYPGLRATSAARVVRWAARWLPGVDDELAGLRSVVPPGAVCVAIGDARTTYTVALSALAGPKGRVHCFEPLERAARWQTATATVLGCENVTVHRIAVGALGHQCAVHGMTPGPGRCRSPAGPCERRAACGSRQAGAPSPRPAPVPVQTLDGVSRWLGLERVDFIKVDAGSAGRRMLTGGFHTLLRDRPALLVRTEARHRAGHCSDLGSLARSLTASLGYRQYRWGARGWQRTVGVTEDCRTYLFRAQPSRFPQE